MPAGFWVERQSPDEIPLYSRVALAVDVPAEGIRRGDGATVAEYHPVDGEPGYSVEVFDAVGQTVAVLTLPESSLEALRSARCWPCARARRRPESQALGHWLRVVS